MKGFALLGVEAFDDGTVGGGDGTVVVVVVVIFVVVVVDVVSAVANAVALAGIIVVGDELSFARCFRLKVGIVTLA